MARSFYEQKCRICGCDWNHACNDHDYWYAEDLCSACAEKMRPILFSTSMVQAILENRKSNTRRVIKLEFANIYKAACAAGKWSEVFGDAIAGTVIEWYAKNVAKPKYLKGAILYVRETWSTQPSGEYIYKCGYVEPITGKPDCNYLGHTILWHPSIHMPKKAARIFLRVTDVWAEQLQNITDNGAKSEGVKSYWSDPHRDDAPFIGCAKEVGADLCSTRCKAFSQLWNSTVKKSSRDKYGWNSNPWVWVYQFERCGT